MLFTISLMFCRIWPPMQCLARVSHITRLYQCLSLHACFGCWSLLVAALQVRKGNDQIAQARREVRQAVVRQAEVVACTLSAAGGDLAGLMAGGPLFDMVIVDEVPQPTLC